MIYNIEAGPLVMGDFGDGIPDVAIGQPSPRRVAVLLTRKGGTLGPPTEYQLAGSGPSISIAAADVNGDGRLDLVALDGTGGGVTGNFISILVGNGDGTFTLSPHNIEDDVPQFGPVGKLALGDLNGDGIPDIVIQNGADLTFSRCSITTLLGDGRGGFRDAFQVIGQNGLIQRGWPPRKGNARPDSSSGMGHIFGLRTSAGLPPACSRPAWGPNASQTKPPASRTEAGFTRTLLPGPPLVRLPITGLGG